MSSTRTRSLSIRIRLLIRRGQFTAMARAPLATGGEISPGRPAGEADHRPTDRSRPVGLIGLRRSAGSMRAIGTAGELQDDRTVHQPIKKCRRQRRIAQVIGPVP